MARGRDRRTTVERGYGGEHVKLRAFYRAEIDAGRGVCTAPVCLEPSRWIRPHAPFDLGHTPDRQTYTGAQHPRCNRSEAGKRGNPKGKPKPFRYRPDWRTTRPW